MGHKEGNKPKFKDKEGNMMVQIFINKNAKGKKYAVYKISRLRFPFQYCASIDLHVSEMDKLKKVMERLPEIEIEQKEKKK